MLKVLIVDDEAPTREWIEFCVRNSSVDCKIVGTAINGYEALELFKQYLPQLVFADIEMPGMDGIELLRKIKADYPFANIVLLTCHNNFSYVRDAMRLGAAEYILKSEVSKETVADFLEKYNSIVQNQLQHEFYSNPEHSHFRDTDLADNPQDIALLIKVIMTKIEERQLDSVKSKVRELIKLLLKVKPPDVHNVKKEYSKLLRIIVEIFDKSPLDLEDDIELFVMEVPTISQLQEYTETLFRRLEKYAFANNKLSGYISTVLEYIDKHYANPITLNELAGVVNLNTDYLSRLFKEEVGCNFITYLTQVRLENAAIMLRETDMKIYEIAEAVGYPNLSYFSRNFKKYHGVNPFEFKKTR
jgi:two-component system response regulator YesN